MTLDPVAREESIFHTARAIASPHERSAYLAKSCDGDGALRARVESLLKVYLSEPAGEEAILSAGSLLFDQVTHPPIEESIGTLIDRYKLLERLGEGGFGIVYMAEQQHPVRRKVAVKVIKPGRYAVWPTLLRDGTGAGRTDHRVL